MGESQTRRKSNGHLVYGCHAEGRLRPVEAPCVAARWGRKLGRVHGMQEFRGAQFGGCACCNKTGVPIWTAGSPVHPHARQRVARSHFGSSPLYHPLCGSFDRARCFRASVCDGACACDGASCAGVGAILGANVGAACASPRVVTRRWSSTLAWWRSSRSWPGHRGGGPSQAQRRTAPPAVKSAGLGRPTARALCARCCLAAPSGSCALDQVHAAHKLWCPSGSGKRCVLRRVPSWGRWQQCRWVDDHVRPADGRPSKSSGRRVAPTPTATSSVAAARCWPGRYGLPSWWTSPAWWPGRQGAPSMGFSRRRGPSSRQLCGSWVRRGWCRWQRTATASMLVSRR